MANKADGKLTPQEVQRDGQSATPLRGRRSGKQADLRPIDPPVEFSCQRYRLVDRLYRAVLKILTRSQASFREGGSELPHCRLSLIERGACTSVPTFQKC
jgi:hypothetical protein